MRVSYFHIALRIVMIGLFTIIPLHAEEYLDTANLTDNSCPSIFYSDFMLGSLYFNCNNLTWFDCNYNVDEASARATCISPVNNTLCDITFDTYNSGYDHTTTISCGENGDSCFNTIDDSEDPIYIPSIHAVEQECIPYVIDKNCPASLDYYQHTHLKWVACHEGSALGTFENTKNNEICSVTVYSYDDNDPNYNSGGIGCPSCDENLWWGYGGGSLDVATKSDCINAINDETCTNPIFKCDGLSWDWCVNKQGWGKCTNTFLDVPKDCFVHISSVCANGAKNCGSISCEDDVCNAGWNIPDDSDNQLKLQSYAYPQGCIQGTDDKTCVIPHFSHDGLVWDLCVNGSGQGRLTNTESGVSVECTVSVSTNCSSGAKTCGMIDCGKGECAAGWSMPNHPVYYDDPPGCYGTSFSESAGFIAAVSVGSVVTVAAVTTIVVVAVYLGCHRYKRQGYHTVQ